ncbi:MAG: hypothetical protein ACU85V_00135 [Gammaproteobacteria bacterium]
MSKASRFTFIAEQATEVGSDWTNKEIVAFHYFNPNGLVARKRRVDDQIRDLVDAGAVPSGWHLAYGSLASYSRDRMIELWDLKRVNSIKLRTVIHMLTTDCEQAEQKVAEAMGGAAA